MKKPRRDNSNKFLGNLPPDLLIDNLIFIISDCNLMTHEGFFLRIVPLSKSYDQTQVRASIASNLKPYSGPFWKNLNSLGILFQQASKEWLDI